jgi:hypothetical protein
LFVVCLSLSGSQLLSYPCTKLALVCLWHEFIGVTYLFYVHNGFVRSWVYNWNLCSFMLNPEDFCIFVLIVFMSFVLHSICKSSFSFLSLKHVACFQLLQSLFEMNKAITNKEPNLILVDKHVKWIHLPFAKLLLDIITSVYTKHLGYQDINKKEMMFNYEEYRNMVSS